ncbi:MAG TPA: cytochrome c oxidase subunit 3 [Tepidisphaeraceae bacterium]|jgi:heme/copper-type cytochrome/quinol oxidase subunit 3
MLVFLASLAMLFIASMFGYVLIRVTNSEVNFGTIHLPKTLWISTFLMLASSYTIHRAMDAIRREKQALFRTYITATIVFAAVFCAVQTPAMIGLYKQHLSTNAEFQQQRQVNPTPLPAYTPQSNTDERIAGQRSVPFYALVMVLILIHALHVVGGLVSLGMVAYNGFKGRYDHEHYTGVRNCVLYWHFLDIVWIAMFTVIFAFG